MKKINKFKKESQTAITRLANKKGYRNIDDLVDAIQNPFIDVDEHVYQIDQDLLDSIMNMDVTIEDDEDLSVYEMLDNIDDLLNTIC
jgi:hypothetical protein